MSEPSPPPTGRQIEIAAGAHRATVVELGATLRTYSVDGRDRIDGFGRDETSTGSRGQVLMPWPNRIASGTYEFAGASHQLAITEPAKHNAIHGLVRDAKWQAAAVEADRVTMAHTLLPQPGYPFTLALEIEYAVSGAGLAVRASATNIGAAACPYGAGFHPYLRLDPEHIDPLVLRLPASASYRSDDDLIPITREAVAGTELDFRHPRAIGATRMDTAFTELERAADGRATVSLLDPASGDRVALWCDESYGYLMIFTGDALPDPERRRAGLAVEPMTCAPDAFRSGDGLVVLEPGASVSGSWGITASSRHE